MTHDETDQTTTIPYDGSSDYEPDITTNYPYSTHSNTTKSCSDSPQTPGNPGTPKELSDPQSTPQTSFSYCGACTNVSSNHINQPSQDTSRRSFNSGNSSRPNQIYPSNYHHFATPPSSKKPARFSDVTSFNTNPAYCHSTYQLTKFKKPLIPRSFTYYTTTEPGTQISLFRHQPHVPAKPTLPSNLTSTQSTATLSHRCVNSNYL